MPRARLVPASLPSGPSERAARAPGAPQPAARRSEARRDWEELFRLRVPASLLANWQRISPAPLHVIDAAGRLIARFGAQGVGAQRCDGRCGALHAPAAAVVACSQSAGHFHISAPIAFERGPRAGTAVTAAWRPRDGDGPDADGLDAALVPVLLRLLEVLTDEMRLFWRTQRRAGQAADPLEGIITRSPEIHAVLHSVRRAAATDRNVLVSGETGTGKDLVARALHALSRRRERPFVAVNCGALPDSLLDTELFGHSRGAFTGAAGERRGLIEAAEGGTLFLDEVPSMSPTLQAKLLRVVEEGWLLRVGSVAPVRTNVRIVAATNVDLRTLVSAGRFREDLLHRLEVLRVDIPPLRDRPEDIEPLARHFIARTCAEEGAPLKGLAAAALDALLRYPWPGNVRELAHALERAVIDAEGEVIQLHDLSVEVRGRRGAALRGSQLEESASGTSPADAGDGAGRRPRPRVGAGSDPTGRPPGRLDGTPTGLPDADAGRADPAGAPAAPARATRPTDPCAGDGRDGAAVPAGSSLSFSDLKRLQVERWERGFLAAELDRCLGNQSRLARELRMSRRKLGLKLRDYGLVGGSSAVDRDGDRGGDRLGAAPPGDGKA